MCETPIGTIQNKDYTEAASFMGIRINLFTSDRLTKCIYDCIRSKSKTVIAHHNLHSLCLHSSASHDGESLRRFYESAHFVVVDGMSIVFLARLQGHQVQRRNRVAYNDWLPVILSHAVRNRWRLFYLGSSPSASSRGAEILRKRYPGLEWKGHHGHFECKCDGDANKKVLAEIANYRPDMLFVGMGMPRQEIWIQENLGMLQVPVIVTSGASLDYIAGEKRMAPRWMGQVGVEWIFRLATEPRRLAYRYLVEPWGLASVIVRSVDPRRGTKRIVRSSGS